MPSTEGVLNPSAEPGEVCVTWESKGIFLHLGVTTWRSLHLAQLKVLVGSTKGFAIGHSRTICRAISCPLQSVHTERAKWGEGEWLPIRRCRPLWRGSYTFSLPSLPRWGHARALPMNCECVWGHPIPVTWSRASGPWSQPNIGIIWVGWHDESEAKKIASPQPSPCPERHIIPYSI